MSKSKKAMIITSLAVVIFSAAITVFFVTKNSDSKPTPDVKVTSAKKLVFEDNFDGTSLDKGKWNTCYDNYSIEYSGCTNYGNNENEWYLADNVSVKNGNLILQANKKGTNGQGGDGQYKWYQYNSGMVSTGSYLEDTPEKWSGTYGYYEAKIKVPEGQAVWPAFWLLPIGSEWPPEIDIMEILGQSPNELLTTYHWRNQDDSVAQDSTLTKNGASLADDWHIYSMSWTKDSIDWYLDGKIVKHVEGKNVPNTAMQIIFNLAIGGNLPGYPNDSTPTSSQMLVDYVRVYQ